MVLHLVHIYRDDNLPQGLDGIDCFEIEGGGPKAIHALKEAGFTPSDVREQKARDNIGYLTYTDDDDVFRLQYFERAGNGEEAGRALEEAGFERV